MVCATEFRAVKLCGDFGCIFTKSANTVFNASKTEINPSQWWPRILIEGIEYLLRYPGRKNKLDHPLANVELVGDVALGMICNQKAGLLALPSNGGC